MNNIKNVIPYLFWIAFFVFTNVAIIYMSIAFTDKTLLNLINKHNGYSELIKYVDVSENEIPNIASDLQQYIIGKKKSLNTKVTLNNGETIDFYNDKALFHMKEVRDIITTLINTSYIFLIVGFFCFLYMKKHYYQPIRTLYNAFLPMYIIYIILILTISIFGLTSFDTFFIKLHETIFNNDMWLFDPRTEYIISLLPASLFFNILKRIVIMMVVFILYLLFCYLYLSKIQPRREATQSHGNDDQVVDHPEGQAH